MRDSLRNASLGPVVLRVEDIDRVSAFYRDVLGFWVDASERAATIAPAAAGAGHPLLVLEHAPGASRPPPRAPGLFHVAFLYPDRGALARAVTRVREAGWPFQGFADHAVSEAAYLADPEGNGIELYADRPRSGWRRHGDELHITTEPLDLEDLMARAADPPGPDGDDPGVGHIHLKVGSLDEAEAFYVGHLGFDVMARAYPGALFIGADGYHHHLGLNVWTSRGSPAPPEDSLGIVSFELIVPDDAQRKALLGGAGEGELEAPFGLRVRVRG